MQRTGGASPPLRRGRRAMAESPRVIYVEGELVESATQTTPMLVESFDDECARNRFAPRRGDEVYLQLSDLLLALRPRLESARGDWLDFGSGVSPYLRYMTSAEVRRADI